MPVLVVLGIIALIFYIGQETGLLQFAMTVAASGVALSGLIRFALILYNIPSFLTPRTSGTDVVLDVNSSEVERFEKSIDFATPAIAVGIALLFSMILTPPNVSGYRDPLIGQVSFIFNVGGPLLAAIIARFWRFLPSVRKMAEARAASLAGQFAALTQQLNAIEQQVNSVASRVAIAAPPSRLPEIVGAFQDFGQQLALGRPTAEFQLRIDEILAAAHADLSALAAIADEIGAITSLHKVVTEKITSLHFYSLFSQVDEVWAFINSSHISDLIQDRRYGEILSQIAGVKIELEEILEKADSLRPEGPAPRSGSAHLDIWDEDIQLVSNDLESTRIALARLAAKEGDPPQRLKKIYHGLAKAFNEDQNKEDGDNRRFRQINEAYQFLLSEGWGA